jgi:hypothetical protein
VSFAGAAMSAKIIPFPLERVRLPARSLRHADCGEYPFHHPLNHAELIEVQKSLRDAWNAICSTPINPPKGNPND